MVHISADLRVGSLALLSGEHVPEQVEPFVQKWVVHCLIGDERLRETFSALGVNALLAVHVHIIAVGDYVPVLVTSGIRPILNLDAGVGTKQCSRTIEHFIAHKVLVYVRVEQVLLVLLIVCLLWPRASEGGDGAVVHHGISAGGAGNHGDVGHRIVVHIGSESVCVRRASLPQRWSVVGGTGRGVDGRR